MSDTRIAQYRLFRRDSLRASELAWEGRPTLVVGVPAAFVSFASMALAAAIAALITFGAYARRVDMEGAVLPSAGLMAISSPSAGWIAALAVREGQIVEKGALLYTLDLDTITEDGRTQQQIINTQTAAQEMLTQDPDERGDAKTAAAEDREPEGADRPAWRTN